MVVITYNIVYILMIVPNSYTLYNFFQLKKVKKSLLLV